MKFITLLKIILCSLTCFTLSVRALDLKDIYQKFNNTSALTANFTQTKSMQALKQELASSGELIIIKEKGIIWHQTKPFNLKLILTDDSIKQIVQNQQISSITKEQNPQIFNFSNIMKAILNANDKTIKEYFAYTIQGDINSFSLELTPLQDPLNKAFISITIKASNYIDEIIIKDRLQDITHICFSNQYKLTDVKQYYTEFDQ